MVQLWILQLGTSHGVVLGTGYGMVLGVTTGTVLGTYHGIVLAIVASLALGRMHGMECDRHSAGYLPGMALGICADMAQGALDGTMLGSVT
eukprot:3091172-Ditylum_brightwellii.AAC.1